MIILSHHAPTFHKTFRKEYENSKLKHCFASELDHLLKKPILYWVFGHTHSFTNYINENNVRIISNPLGNSNELGCYKDGFSIEFKTI
jgi:hypothetical protein